MISLRLNNDPSDVTAGDLTTVGRLSARAEASEDG